MKNRKHARGLSLILCAALLAGQLGTAVYAKGISSDIEGLCEHHQKHTAECGYREAEAGHPCEHVHTNDCYSNEVNCGYEDEDMELATDSDAVHEHTQDCYPLDCPHKRGEHDDNCGYRESVESQACGYVCEECGKEPGLNPEQPEETAVFTITDFDELDEKVQFQTVPVGTRMADLKLPSMLGASGYTVDESNPETVIIQSVKWESGSTWDESVGGRYVFTAILPAGYTCTEGLSLPEIFVQIGAENAALLNLDGYNAGDVAVINKIIEKNGLAWTENAPTDWGKNVVWDDSPSKRIVELYLYNEGLHGELDVSDLEALTTLECSYNTLTALNVSGLSKLRSLLCGYNELEKLDLSNLPGLWHVSCNDNQLTELKVSGSDYLVNITCTNNQLTELDLSALSRLTGLSCANNRLTELELSGLSKLDTLDCSKNELTELDLSAQGNLQLLFCTHNELTELDLYEKNDLMFLMFNNNPLKSFRAVNGFTMTINQTNGGTVKADSFDLNNSELKLSATPVLGYGFKEWNVSPGTLSSGTSVSIPLNQSLSAEAVFENTHNLSDIKAFQEILEAHPSLKNVSGMDENDLTSWQTAKLVTWDTSNPKRITELKLNNRSLSGKLAVSELTALTRLECYANQLEILEVSGLKDLKELYCSMNSLTELKGLKDLTALTKLNCDVNRLEALTGLEKLTNITYLDCYHNHLKGTLDVSGLKDLTHLDCSENQLAELDVSGKSSLKTLYCYNNPFTFFKTKDDHTLTVRQTANGTVWTTAYEFGSNEVELTAEPDTDYGFENWPVLPLGVPSDTNPVSLSLNDNVTAEAAFSYVGAVYTISGTVKGSDTDAGIPATLQLKQGNVDVGRAVTADSNGAYMIPDVIPGTYIIEVSCTGYENKVIDNITVSDTNVNGRNLTLTKTFVPVTGISMINAATVHTGADLSLEAAVIPDTATNTAIEWSVDDAGSTGAAVTGNTFKASAAGTAVVKAVIKNGLANGRDYAQTFYIEVTLEPDTTKPTVSLVSPTGSDAAVNGKIEITFSEEMDITEGSVALSGGSGTVDVLGSWSAGGTVFAIGYSGLAYNTDYTIHISGFKDIAGNEMEANTDHRFKTVTRSFGSSDSGGGDSTAQTSALRDSYKVSGDRINETISLADLKQLADSGRSLTLSCDKAGMTFHAAALKAVFASVPATVDGITFSASPADLNAFSDAAALIGARPAYDFTITSKDGRGENETVKVKFPADSASITLNYIPEETEITGSLFMVCVDDSGAVIWLDKSGYDRGMVLADVPHFSVYGVACKTSAPVFSDTADHWAKEDIEFTTARGLFTGTESDRFLPDGAITRGLFVTALGRLAGVDPGAFETRSFTDVKSDTYYAPYIEWAVQNNIVKGTGDGLFSPEAPVTREQMASMMANYAEQMGITIPAVLDETAFADSDTISAWAAKEVKALQQAGIVKGRVGNRFDPQADVTRAEAAAVLHRFVKIVIDPASAQGWAANDSGQWFYYENGRPVVGWKELGGRWYYFYADGLMAADTDIDGYKIGPDGVWNS